MNRHLLILLLTLPASSHASQNNQKWLTNNHLSDPKLCQRTALYLLSQGHQQIEQLHTNIQMPIRATSLPVAIPSKERPRSSSYPTIKPEQYLMKSQKATSHTAPFESQQSPKGFHCPAIKIK